MSGLAVLIILGVLIAGYIWTQSESFKNAAGPGVTPPQGNLASLPGTGDFDFEIVGESKYQKALRAIAGAGEVRHECTARILLEDENPYDNKAVRVDIGGKTVGYFSREDARSYRRQIAKHGRIVGECDAVIIGGGKGRSLGVWLDLPTND